MANLANNHAFDQGPQGLLDSIRNIKRAGILPVGAGTSQEKADAPAYIEVKGWTIAVVAVGEVTDPVSQVAVGDEIGTSVGHSHAHRLQPMDTYEAKPIFYGLRMLVWPRFSAEGSATAVAEAVFRPNGEIVGRLCRRPSSRTATRSWTDAPRSGP